MHLRLHPLGHLKLRLGQDLHLNMRAEIARLRIDGLIFLFDSDRQAGPLHVFTPCSQSSEPVPPWPALGVPPPAPRHIGTCSSGTRKSLRCAPSPYATQVRRPYRRSSGSSLPRPSECPQRGPGS